MKTRYLILTLLSVAIAGLSACSNTFHGAGRDVENAGETVQKAVPAR